jgi:2-keto-4-pentenoate hydratase/2-oxohepta-3-ene-1,7-dioic acid hydratase in catechol pathway
MKIDAGHGAVVDDSITDAGGMQTRSLHPTWVRDTLGPVRVVTFESERGASIGALVDGGVVDLADLLPADSPQAMLEALIDGEDDLRDAIEERCRTRTPHPLDAVRLRASVPAPGKVLAVMRNRPGLEEGSAPPYAYLKYAAGGVGTGEPLPLPADGSGLAFAPGLAVVVRGPAKDLAPADWRDAVFGFTGFLDVVRPGSAFGSGEDWWKSWDTSFAVGPAIVTADEVADPGGGVALTVTTPTGTFTGADPGRPPVDRIVSFASSVMTLRTGDLIACGAHDAAIVPAAPGSRVQLEVPSSGRIVVETAA